MSPSKCCCGEHTEDGVITLCAWCVQFHPQKRIMAPRELGESPSLLLETLDERRIRERLSRDTKRLRGHKVKP